MLTLNKIRNNIITNRPFSWLVNEKNTKKVELTTLEQIRQNIQLNVWRNAIRALKASQYKTNGNMSHQINDTMQIDFKGIRLTIKLTKWAMEQYAFEMARVLLRYPDFSMRTFGEISAATLLCCCYYGYCKENGYAIIYDWEDFYRQVVVDFTTPAKTEQLKEIFNKYLNIQQNGIK